MLATRHARIAALPPAFAPSRKRNRTASILERLAFYVLCDLCGEVVASSLQVLVLVLPQVQRFWHAHLRIQTLPMRHVDALGQAALVARVERLPTASGVEVVIARDTLLVLGCLTLRAG